jgi:hypothetical protein
MLAQTRQFVDPTAWRSSQLMIEPPPAELLQAAPIDLSKLLTWPAQPITGPPSEGEGELLGWLRRHQVAIAVGAAALFALAALKAVAR